MKSLQIQRFRMLDDIDIRGLGQLNLIVGSNNAGKSTVLEALRIFAKRGNPSTLMDILGSRNETVAARLVDVEDTLGDNGSLRNLFFGREFPVSDDLPIIISDVESHKEIKLEHAYFKFIEDQIVNDDGENVVSRKRVRIQKNEINDEPSVQQTLIIRSENSVSYFPLEKDRLESLSRMSRTFVTAKGGETPVNILSTRFLHPDRLASLWDQAVLTNAADAVIEGLKLIEPTVQGLAFVKSEEADRSFRYLREESAMRTERIAMIKLKGNQRPIPLGSMGDGMLRVLQLLLAIYPAKNGFFLIDEFENGLHHSIQEGLWKLLFEIAKKLKVQVFATTHSRDCISSFANISEQRKDIEGVLFRLKKIPTDDGRHQIIATSFPEDELIAAQKFQIDLR